MRFRPLPDAEELDSPGNHGWRFGVACSSAAVALYAIVSVSALLMNMLGKL